MKKILIFAANLILCVGFANAGVRDGTVVTRGKNTATQGRVSTTAKRVNSSRGTVVAPRAATTQSVATRATTARATATTNRGPARTDGATRTQTRTISRAATTTGAISETRTGAAYEQCKNAYFSCMDQFCTLKNDDYRRCSCNDRVFDLAARRDVLAQAGEQLTVFTENLDVVGMTAAQAAAMKTASEGENALTEDKSASKALLQAIMNSIRGEDSTVGGKFTDLNSIHISFDTANAFGMTDVGQAIAGYNGKNLYSAVYPQCRQAVKNDCTDAALQRAITAYLMAVEQDCNTVQTAIENTQKQMKSALREGSAMLDLARIENRQKHNSSDIATCISAVESAILSEQVCGENYHKCLDNGEYIDISTGKPITGVTDFYKLQDMLVFKDGVESADQKLSANANNRTFVKNFEARTKKFAADALDKCVENADIVWQEYLDKALLDIYYAQRDKVAEIKQGCFDYVSSCYINADGAITSAMSALSGTGSTVLQPDKIALTDKMCSDYVASCNNMFKGQGDIIAMYIQERQDTDTLAACRAIVKQCFDSYGGTNYENFYYPYSGLFKTGKAPDWFTLYDITLKEDGAISKTYKSECAKQLAEIDACSDKVEAAFGGLDSMYVTQAIDGNETVYKLTEDTSQDKIYGLINNEETGSVIRRALRPTGVATEVYNQIVDILSTQCMNLQGRFVETQFIKSGYDSDNLCLYTEKDDTLYGVDTIKSLYGIGEEENMCPKDYALGVDTKSWGICSCWENGARRSKDGTSAKCEEVLWSDADADWADAVNISGRSQVCPFDYINNTGTNYCCKPEEANPETCKENTDLTQVPEGI